MSAPANVYYQKLRKAFGNRVPCEDSIEVCRCLYPCVLGFFYETAQLIEPVRVHRVWIEAGSLQTAVTGSAPGLDDILCDVEEEARAAMAAHCTCARSDRFTLGIGRQYHARLRRLYGDVVPPRDVISIRSGLYDIVGQLFAKLAFINLRDLRVRRIETRNAGFSRSSQPAGVRGPNTLLRPRRRGPGRHANIAAGMPG